VTGGTGDTRHRVRRLIRYARVLRATVQRGAAEHARWAHFLYVTAARLRGAGDAADGRDAEMARRYAAYFAALRARFRGVVPPTGCEAVHRAALDWLEALDLLSAAVPTAVHARSRADVEAVGRAADGARRHLRDVQREYADTAAVLRAEFRARPRVGRRSRSARAVA
jgi:hypothetical protein